ncbi:hypothetical protein ATCC27039_07350 [Actinomyces naeslundii]|nr:hypothetical protein ATCC27039_07350 [Actinomyces naeslundii]
MVDNSESIPQITEIPILIEIFPSMVFFMYGISGMMYQNADLPMIKRMYPANKNKANNVKDVKIAEM